MAFRPNWYEQEQRGRSRFAGDPRAWSGVGLLLRLTTAVFVLQFVLRLTHHDAASEGLVRWAGLNVFATDGSINLLFPLQLVTYPFLHGSGLWHFGFNMLALWMFGRQIEAELGKRAFLKLFFGGAIAGGLAQVAWALWRTDAGPVIGASGAIYAVMVLYALTYPRNTIIFIFIPLPAIAFIGILVAFDLMQLLEEASVDPASVGRLGGTAFACHLGGALFGALWYQRSGVIANWLEQRQRRAVARESEREGEDRREMDRILAKIQSDGLGSLGGSERAFLERRSEKLRNGQR